jgi:SAM-dependent methyltransferase
MGGYYAEKLAAERLRACYALAPPRVRAYLEAEIEFVLARAAPSDVALELGCGYGRVLERVLPRVKRLAGVDTSRPSLALARESLPSGAALHLLAMDASQTGFRDRVFDLTFCVQNGICAFGVDPLALFREAVRITRPGGTVLFSSYAERFWPDRLEWFRAQAVHGLIGPIDEEATGDGVIVCRDGLRLATMHPAGFTSLAAALGLEPRLADVAGSCVFCELTVP